MLSGSLRLLGLASPTATNASADQSSTPKLPDISISGSLSQGTYSLALAWDFGGLSGIADWPLPGLSLPRLDGLLTLTSGGDLTLW